MRSIINLTDQQLIQLFINGDANALEDLINRHKDRIFTSIVILVKDKNLAEDLFQEVFIKIIDTLRSGSYTDEGKFLPWALRIAHNLCVDHFRKAKRTPVVYNKSEEYDMFDNLNITEDGAESKIMKSQTHEKIRQMLDLLPEDQREVIVLRHFANLSFKEIAEKTNCSINTALGRMRYGLINLRKMMVEHQVAL
ncbi:MAG: RNA polymerase sigma factor [Chitinophagia bacterium]|jgi:RNA polymerase sigma factor (sigma-70 family)